MLFYSIFVVIIFYNYMKSIVVPVYGRHVYVCKKEKHNSSNQNKCKNTKNLLCKCKDF